MCIKHSIHLVPNHCRRVVMEGPLKRCRSYMCCTKPWRPPRMGKLKIYENIPFTWGDPQVKGDKGPWCIIGVRVGCIIYITIFLPINISHKRKTHQEPPFWKYISPHLPVVQPARHQSPCLPLLAALSITGTEDPKGRKQRLKIKHYVSVS